MTETLAHNPDTINRLPARFINWIDGKVPALGAMPINPHQSINWSDYHTARSRSERIGFVLNGDGFACLDIDKCLLTDGTWHPDAQKLFHLFPGAAAEVSQSGQGMHILFRVDPARFASKRRKFKFGDVACEFYCGDRYIAFGPHGWQGDPCIDFTDAAASIVPDRDEAPVADLPAGPVPEYTGPADDDVLIGKMLASQGSAAAAFGAKASVAALWEGDASALSQTFPSSAGDVFDRSSADAALMSHLAFWTGKDAARMDRLFRRSALVRAKYLEREDYRTNTLAHAISGCRRVYDVAGRRAAQIEELKRIGADLDEPPEPTIMTVDDMIRDLVFVEGAGAIVNVKNMRVRKRERAGDTFAASKCTIERPGEKPKIVPALHVWLGSPQRVSVDVMTWAPGERTFCRPPEGSDAGDRAINTWRGFRPNAAPSDWRIRVQPFLEHLTYLVPIESERAGLLMWLGHIFQRPGDLPHTCYLFVTETTGIGRNWLSSALVRALRGYSAAGISISEVLDGSFNGRLSRKLLAVVDETREGMSERRYQRGERLKSLITEEFRHINPKYGVQSIERNCCRWLMFSNHYDALPFDNNDRRVIVVENPTERAAPEWYQHIYALLDQPEFIASVRHYLETIDLTAFRPGGHAPVNSAKIKALDAMMSETDRAVRDFADIWPGDLACRSDLREFVKASTGSMNVSETHLTHAIARTSMISAGKRIKHNGRAESVIIVRNVTAEQLAALDPSAVSRAINHAGSIMRSSSPVQAVQAVQPM